MISRLEGTVMRIDPRAIVVSVGGVGFLVFTTTEMIARAREGEKVLLETRLVVKEDSLDLYGFPNREELSFFELLISVSGVGPKGALSIISIGTISSLKKAIAGADVPYLTRVSGIGKKTAEKIVIELRDKLSALGYKDEDGHLRLESEAMEVLLELGYSRESAREALKNVPAGANTNDKIKSALKILSGK